ncbi:HAD-superfamily hydrolase, subfamily IB (PSPase-like) [Thermodesulfobium narugense DSM 14796]|uniref:HAD-superfamily hydrolase, subfamily IB (PSPase-like) n=1 Tax=Thermodesulfobium narugense DSM 14796 TaxID=747365 RepID=M1E5R7_9BACT|nr:MtnX-like HAD-IB family phosphatase [Thermodesulfobium narugense]AEE13808.1 HAD-superfamily hydrolase, subfamily IB (PSPase-like) [Thermodesulfobium narugense DSM 14796]
MKKIIFCDFDGTITKKDTVDEFLREFALPEWEKIELLWQKGAIGSDECLKRQIDCVEHITLEEIYNFLDLVEIDNSFVDFYYFIRDKDIDLIVLSDGFDLFIEYIFKRLELDIRFFSNSLTYKQGRLSIDFPYRDNLCQVSSGMCKCKIIEKYSNEQFIYYIGNGRSDFCPVKLADFIFSKNELTRFSFEKGYNFYNFDSFSEIKDLISYHILDNKFFYKNYKNFKSILNLL